MRGGGGGTSLLNVYASIFVLVRWSHREESINEKS